MSAPQPSLRAVLLSGLALGALMGTSWALSSIALGWWSTVLALGIAVAKAVVILTVFIGIQRQPVANRVVIAVAVALVVILIGFVALDVVRR